MSNEVFCNECKHYFLSKRSHANPDDIHHCYCPNLYMKVKIKDTPIKEGKIKKYSFSYCYENNRNKDCKYFEKKFKLFG